MLFQIAREKSCNYLVLLIIYMKKFDMVKQMKCTRITQSEKLRHPGHALDLKTKDLIDSDKTSQS